MSRAYQIQIVESIRRVVHVDDGVCSSLELLPVLPPEQMAEILEAELEERGYEKDENGQWGKKEGDAKVTVSKEGEVKVSIEKEREVSVSTNITRTVAKEQEQKAREDVRKDLENQVEAEKKAAQDEISTQLEGKLADLRKEFDGISHKVTATALKRKASSMGEVLETSENPENGSLTIRVKV